MLIHAAESFISDKYWGVEYDKVVDFPKSSHMYSKVGNLHFYCREYTKLPMIEVL